jgi:hypothetical protein
MSGPYHRHFTLSIEYCVRIDDFTDEEVAAEARELGVRSSDCPRYHQQQILRALQADTARMADTVARLAAWDLAMEMNGEPLALCAWLDISPDSLDVPTMWAGLAVPRSTMKFLSSLRWHGVPFTDEQKETIRLLVFEISERIKVVPLATSVERAAQESPHGTNPRPGRPRHR